MKGGGDGPPFGVYLMRYRRTHDDLTQILQSVGFPFYISAVR